MDIFYSKIDQCSASRDNWLLIVTEGRGFGEKAIVEDGKLTWTSHPGGFLEMHAESCLAEQDSGMRQIENSRIYAERIGRQPRLVVCGAGHVSMPVIRLAKKLGFFVIAIDDRPEFAQNAVNEGADQAYGLPFDTALEEFESDIHTYFVIVTRGHRYDTLCLRRILKMPHAYIGMMGSRRRSEMVKKDLLLDGFGVDLINSICTPIGLPIGAETPEEIAVSILAEVIQVKNNRQGQSFPEDILNDILGSQRSCSADSLPGRKILCTLVDRKGSGPRNTGARMLVTSEGKALGTIGGGYMESRVIRKAEELFREPVIRPVLMRISLTADEAAMEGEVCGGTIEIWLEEV